MIFVQAPDYLLPSSYRSSPTVTFYSHILLDSHSKDFCERVISQDRFGISYVDMPFQQFISFEKGTVPPCGIEPKHTTCSSCDEMEPHVDYKTLMLPCGHYYHLSCEVQPFEYLSDFLCPKGCKKRGNSVVFFQQTTRKLEDDEKPYDECKRCFEQITRTDRSVILSDCGHFYHRVCYNQLLVSDPRPKSWHLREPGWTRLDTPCHLCYRMGRTDSFNDGTRCFLCRDKFSSAVIMRETPPKYNSHMFCFREPSRWLTGEKLVEWNVHVGLEPSPFFSHSVFDQIMID